MKAILQSRWFLILFLFLAAIPSAFPRRINCTAVTCLENRLANDRLSESWTLVGGQDSGKLQRIQPAIEFPEDADWLNTHSPVTMSEMKGKLVLLDFWTYCCINCMHVLPVLKQAEEEFAKDLVVVGVHTAKFATESDTENIREAVLRYEITHPILNDQQQSLWNAYQLATWPTLVLIDPEGFVIWSHSGEIAYKDLQKVLKRAVGMYSNGRLSGKHIEWKLERDAVKPTPLRFPGKVLAHAKSNRLFIADTNHHRIVITGLDGSLIEIIGSGRSGRKDGSYGDSSFFHPQGLALGPKNQLYVCDTNNHLIRRIDLEKKEVFTVAGTGQQLTFAFPGFENASKLPSRIAKKPKSIPIASPWDACVVGNDLYIAMAGPHQIWKMSLDEKNLGPYAGNGVEDIVDGPLLPSAPYATDSSSFAQPSGLATNGSYLFVADSEGSSIRAVPLDPKSPVETVIGTSSLPRNRLYTFGDADGPKSSALLQHPLGVAFYRDHLLVADTYNNKIKRIDLANATSTTLFGSLKSGETDDPPLLDEPGGLSVADDKIYIADTNNHLIRVWDLRISKLSTLEISGLHPPGKATLENKMTARPSIAKDAIRSKQKPAVLSQDRKLSFQVELGLPKGWKLNEEAPLGYHVLQSKGSKREPMGETVTQRIVPPRPEFTVDVQIVEGTDLVQVAVTYYYCQEDGTGVCLADTVVFEVPLTSSGSPEPKTVLRHVIAVRPK